MDDLEVGIADQTLLKEQIPLTILCVGIGIVWVFPNTGAKTILLKQYF